MAEGDPAGPEGVWLEYADGTKYEDLPLLFLGYDETGCAQFEILSPRDENPVSAGARTWPGMTSLLMPKLDPKETA